MNDPTTKSCFLLAHCAMIGCIWLALLGVSVVSALPYQLVDSGRPKCSLAELPEHTVVRIHYDAPDMMLDSDKGGPTYITIMERPIKTVKDIAKEEEEDDDEVERKRIQLQKEKKKNPPASHELKQVAGYIDHKVKQDSEINVCIRASMAGSKNPMRFGLRLEELSEEQVESEDARKNNSEPQADVDKHLSSMESQLGHIEHLMHAVIKNADMARELDALHHRHTDALYKATTFWPFVHVGILLVTGFTQVNHIVQFFKKHRII